MVQVRREVARSATIAEWMNAVAVSHGRRRRSRPDPSPVAPAEDLVAPPRSGHNAGGEEDPRPERPAADDPQPRRVQAAGDERGHGQGERERKPGVAEVQEGRDGAP